MINFNQILYIGGLKNFNKFRNKLLKVVDAEIIHCTDKFIGKNSNIDYKKQQLFNTLIILDKDYNVLFLSTKTLVTICNFDIKYNAFCGEEFFDINKYFIIKINEEKISRFELMEIE